MVRFSRKVSSAKIANPAFRFVPGRHFSPPPSLACVNCCTKAFRILIGLSACVTVGLKPHLSFSLYQHGQNPLSQRCIDEPLLLAGDYSGHGSDPGYQSAYWISRQTDRLDYTISLFPYHILFSLLARLLFLRENILKDGFLRRRRHPQHRAPRNRH